MRRVISVTRRHVEFLYGRTKVENMREEVRDIFRRIAVEDAELLARLADGSCEESAPIVTGHGDMQGSVTWAGSEG